MPMAVNFRWKQPFIQAPQTYWDRNGVGEGISHAANAISAGLQRRRQNRLEDERIARENEDRERRIAEEDRRKATYGKIADDIRGAAQQRAELVKQRESIMARIDEISARLEGLVGGM